VPSSIELREGAQFSYLSNRFGVSH